MQIINFLGSLCSWGDWFESRFVVNPEDRYCRVEAHLVKLETAFFNYSAPNHMLV